MKKTILITLLTLSISNAATIGIMGVFPGSNGSGKKITMKKISIKGVESKKVISNTPVRKPISIKGFSSQGFNIGSIFNR